MIRYPDYLHSSGFPASRFMHPIILTTKNAGQQKSSDADLTHNLNAGLILFGHHSVPIHKPPQPEYI